MEFLKSCIIYHEKTEQMNWRNVSYWTTFKFHMLTNILLFQVKNARRNRVPSWFETIPFRTSWYAKDNFWRRRWQWNSAKWQRCINLKDIRCLCPECSANPTTVTPIWKWKFANKKHLIRGLYRTFFEKYLFKFPFSYKRFQMGQKM